MMYWRTAMPLYRSTPSDVPTRRDLFRSLVGCVVDGDKPQAPAASPRELGFVLPPWSGEDAGYMAACTGCGECVSACPENILVLQQGVAWLNPALGGCDFCAACVDTCKPKVLDLTRAALTVRPVFSAACLPVSGVECRVCGDQCEVSAIRFRPRAGGPPMPVLADHCTGCGACVGPCPVAAVSLRDLSPAAETRVSTERMADRSGVSGPDSRAQGTPSGLPQQGD